MADAKVQRVDEFRRGDAIKFKVEGFGGTGFPPAFEHVDHEQLNLACLIYLTDGDGVYTEKPSTYPTRWAITIERHGGETVYIEVTVHSIIIRTTKGR
jgi:predicted metal-dependent peptidase